MSTIGTIVCLLAILALVGIVAWIYEAEKMLARMMKSDCAILDHYRNKYGNDGRK